MSLVTLRAKGATAIPIEADCLTPEAVADRSAAEIEGLTVWLGNREEPLGEYFTVTVADGESAEPALVIEGDCAHVKWIGKGMARGKLEIRGRAGMHLGAYQSGGEIDCLGDAADWPGAMMSGGVLRIRGNAGHLVGAGYRGEPVGMTGGSILIHGAAGNEAGAGMGRGLLVVLGNLGDAAGLAMRAGTILCGGELGIRPGANMQRGSVIALGKAELLPTFRYTCTYVPPYLRLLSRKLATLGVALPEGVQDGEFRLYAGDLAASGKGEVLLWAAV